MQFYFLISVLVLLQVSCRTSPTKSTGQGFEDPDYPAKIQAAKDILNIIGSRTQEGKCTQSCHWHAMNELTLLGFINQTKTVQDCDEHQKIGNGNAATIASKRIDCLRTQSFDHASPFSKKIGFYRGHLGSDTWEALFKAQGEPNSADQLKGFRQEIAMPPLASQLPGFTEAEFEKIALWSQAVNKFNGRDYMPGLREALGVADGPTECKQAVETKFYKTLDRLRLTGWQARNMAKLKSGEMSMFACPKGSTADFGLCFQDKTSDGKDRFPLHSDLDLTKTWLNAKLAATLPKTRLRLLTKLPYRSSYWLRSSPDGRFLASGLSEDSFAKIAGVPPSVRSVIVDLASVETRPYLGVDKAEYDPGFFPDSSGFTFHGLEGATKAVFCSMKLLQDLKITVIDPLAMTNECSTEKVGTYQTVSSPLKGDVSLVISSKNYASDKGGEPNDFQPIGFGEDPYTFSFAMPNNTLQIMALKRNKDKWTADAHYDVEVPFEGDFVASPSGVFVAGRIAGGGVAANTQQGYKIRELSLSAQGKPSLEPLATFCVKGSKPSFSFDERFMVLHHYVDGKDAEDLGMKEDDPAFLNLTGHSSNIILLDMKTSKTYRLTTMGLYQFALYPHFRSDGWLTFLVRDRSAKKEYVMVSDIALNLPD